MLDLFTRLSVPFYQKDKNSIPEVLDKTEVIEEILEELQLNKYHDELNYLMYTSGELEVILQDKYFVFITHIDLIKKFHKGFTENKEPYVEKDDGIIAGALDNTITNAALIKSMLENKFKENIIFLFTYGEESGMWGINSFMKSLGDNVKNGTFINMDVTNEGYDYSISIEYDQPNYKSMIDLIDKYQDDHSVYYTVDRVCDDCDIVLSKGGNGLSVCLPTKGLIHSWNNESTIKKIEEYQEFISKIVETPFKLKKGSDKELTFKDVFKIHKGNKEETLKLIKAEEKKLAKERKERQKRWKSYGSGYTHYKPGYNPFANTPSLFDDDYEEDNRWMDYTMEHAGHGTRHHSLTYFDLISDLIDYDPELDYNTVFILTETLRSEPFKEHEYVPMDVLIEEIYSKKNNLNINIEDKDLEEELFRICQVLIEIGLIDDAQFHSYDTMFFNESIRSHINLDNVSEEFLHMLS